MNRRKLFKVFLAAPLIAALKPEKKEYLATPEGIFDVQGNWSNVPMGAYITNISIPLGY